MIVLFSLIQARLPRVFEKVQFSHLPDPSFIVDFAKAGVCASCHHADDCGFRGSWWQG